MKRKMHSFFFLFGSSSSRQKDKTKKRWKSSPLWSILTFEWETKNLFFYKLINRFRSLSNATRFGCRKCQREFSFLLFFVRQQTTSCRCNELQTNKQTANEKWTNENLNDFHFCLLFFTRELFGLDFLVTSLLTLVKNAEEIKTKDATKKHAIDERQTIACIMRLFIIAIWDDSWNGLRFVALLMGEIGRHRRSIKTVSVVSHHFSFWMLDFVVNSICLTRFDECMHKIRVIFTLRHMYIQSTCFLHRFFFAWTLSTTKQVIQCSSVKKILNMIHWFLHAHFSFRLFSFDFHVFGTTFVVSSHWKESMTKFNYFLFLSRSVVCFVYQWIYFLWFFVAQKRVPTNDKNCS